MQRFLILAVAALAAACAQQPQQPQQPQQSQPSQPAMPPAAAPPAIANACDAAPAQFALGQTQTAPLVEEVRQKSGALMARVLRPNQAVTMEFSGDRVNVVVDAANKVTAVRCG